MEGTNWGCSWGYKVTILVGVISQLMKVKSPKLSTSMYKIYKMHIRVCLTIGHPKNHWFTIMSLLNGFNFGGILHFQTHSNLKWLVSHGFFKKYHMVILNVVLRKKKKKYCNESPVSGFVTHPQMFLGFSNVWSDRRSWPRPPPPSSSQPARCRLAASGGRKLRHRRQQRR